MSLGKKSFAAFSAALLLGACASQPLGPTVQVMPNPNKPFQIFQQEQAECKQYASGEISGQVDEANKRAIGAALLGTAIGAGAGAVAGGGQGAKVGTAAGAVVGTAVGAGSSNKAQLSIQQQYDVAYTQCMYAKGNQVPGMAPVVVPAPAPAPAPAPKPKPKPAPKPSDAPPPPPPSSAPPPPASAPPPPDSAPPPPPPAQ